MTKIHGNTNKINKALKIIYKYLPSTYPKVGVKIYKTCYSMLRASANEQGESYKQHCQWYINYANRHDCSKEDYIDTKYNITKEVNHHIRRYLTYHALAGNPILTNIENTQYYSQKNWIFLLLHEIGHLYYKPKGKEKEYNEHLCDLFAIRWYKRIFKV